MKRRSFLKLIAGPAAAIAAGVGIALPKRKMTEKEFAALLEKRWNEIKGEDTTFYESDFGEGISFRPENYRRNPQVRGIDFDGRREYLSEALFLSDVRETKFLK